jgi:hypothetical protein
MLFLFVIMTLVALLGSIALWKVKFEQKKYTGGTTAHGEPAYKYVIGPLALPLRIGGTLALIVLWVGVFLGTTVYFVPEDGYLQYSKKWGGGSMAQGQVVACNGENGPQAEILPPGPHILPPWQFDAESVMNYTVPPGMIGEVSTADGVPLDLKKEMRYAPAWTDLSQFLDATEFLSSGEGYKGDQVTILVPGDYKFHRGLYHVKEAAVTNVEVGHVKVVKANYGEIPVPKTIKTKNIIEVEEPLSKEDLSRAYKEAADLEEQRQLAAGIPEGKVSVRREDLKVKKTKVVLQEVEQEVDDPLVDVGLRGIWRKALKPGEYFLHTGAHEFTKIATMKIRVAYSTEGTTEGDSIGLAPIMVRSKGGFEFPVDVRVVYHIEPTDAPWVVATIRDDDAVLDKVLTPAVRSIFRNLMGRSKALDFVADRELKQREAKELIAKKCAVHGITIDEVLIGRVGDDSTLGALMKTQKDREIALQQQVTLRVQQKAAEQQKELSKTTQEAEEEKSLAKAAYEVQRAQQRKLQAQEDADAKAIEKRVAAAAEADAILAIAKAEADGYLLKVAALGRDTVRTIEALRIIGDKGLRITPNVMVTGGDSGVLGALAGTLLNDMNLSQTTQ